MTLKTISLLSRIGVLVVVLSDLVGAEAPSIERIPDPAFGHSALAAILEPRSKSLRAELELTETQLAEVAKVKSRFAAASAEIVRKWHRELAKGNASKELPPELVDAHHRVIDEMRQLLSEKQFTRMRQIEFQRTMRLNALLPLRWPQVTSELQLTSDENSRFNRRVKEQQDALQAALENSISAIEPALAARLSSEQRARLADLMGEPMELGEVGRLDTTQPGVEFTRLMRVLSLPVVRHELELIGEQETQIAQLFREIEARKDAIFDKERRARVAAGATGQPPAFSIDDAFAELGEWVGTRLNDILLPHQLKRFQQIRLQFEAREETPIPLLSGAVARELKMSDREREEMKETYVREWESASKKWEAQYRDALRGVVESLTVDQQQRYHLLVGKPFTEWDQ